MSKEEIWVVPTFGQGHLFPCMELCKHIATRDFQATFIISSNNSASIPSSLRQHSLIQVFEIPPSLPQPASEAIPQHRRLHAEMALALENLLSTRSGPKPVCVILDILMGWAISVFAKFHIPIVAFFTSGASSAAMEYATWKAHVEDIQPGEVHLLPGLPEDMAFSYSDLKRRPHGHGPPTSSAGGPPGPKKMGPPKPGNQPPWVDEIEGVITLLINTWEDLERPFSLSISTD
ncbi:UDP-glycosyltransferase 73B4-like [Fagus crenata]